MSIPDRCSRTSRRADAAALWAAALFPSVATWFYFVVLSVYPSAAVQVAFAAEKIVQFAFPAFWVMAVRRQPLRLARPSAAGVGQGLALGAAVLAGMLLLYFQWLKPAGYLAATVAPIRAKVAAYGMSTPAAFVVGGVFFSGVHSLLEEYYWRWFLFGGLRRFMPVAAAVVLSSLAFMAHHVILLAVYFGGLSVATILFSLCVALGGAAWAWIYHRSGSLLGPWLSHLLIDAGIFVVAYDLLWR
jgi:membrane protease YdiL (CAAX protease family)